jgi:hypothetical protein
VFARAGWAPAVVALISGAAAVVFKNPAVSVPSVVVVFFLKPHAFHWVALATGLVLWLSACAAVIWD